MIPSRRTFLQQAAAAMAVGPLVARHTPQMWTAAPAELFPEMDDALLRELAQLAVDEARRAGATFADVRVHAARGIQLRGYMYVAGAALPETWPLISIQNCIGIRALVNGAWGFANGFVLTRESVVEVARIATGAARANQPRHRNALALAPVPAEQGEWNMPIERDPFTVPLGEQREAARAALTQFSSNPKVTEAEIRLHWRKAVTAFASTEGSLLVQRRWLAAPNGTVSAQGSEDWQTKVTALIRPIRVGPLGYEAYAADRLTEGARDAAERAISLSERITKEGTSSVDVGRNELVLPADGVGGLFRVTVSAALDLNRALGYMANQEGTSFAAPPADVLGQMQVASPLLTIRCDRTQPGASATTAWDEEGVRPEEYTLVENGVVKDYHTDRQTAAEIGGWYAARGERLRAHGCARLTGRYFPAIATPNLTMTPGKDNTTVDDLIAGTKRGYYVESCWGQSDQQLINGQFAAGVGGVRKIVNGKLGRYVRDFAFQIITQPFWKNVTAIGGTSSVETANTVTSETELFDPTQLFPYSTFRTVPMHVRDVNVLNTGRTA